MMQKKAWQSMQDLWFQGDISHQQDALPMGLYSLENDQKMGLHFKRLGDNFGFDYKIYAINQEFIDHAYKTYEETNENLGIIFNGIKGTGKTVTAKLLANRINKPIILVHTAFGGVNSFLASIDQEMTIFIDEYDKVYRGNLGTDWDDDSSGEKADSSLLSLMDGVFSMSARRNFFLTTNNTYVNENMINRPGRIRYLKQYGDLTHSQINEIVNDLLKYPEHKESIFSYLKLLEIITVDIVKALVMEVNIFNQPAEVCAKDMNMERKVEEYEVIRVPEAEGQKEEVIITIPLALYNNFMTRSQANILGGYFNHDGTYLRVAGECKIPNTYTVYDANYGRSDNSFNIKFRKKKNIHSSFAF